MQERCSSRGTSKVLETTAVVTTGYTPYMSTGDGTLPSAYSMHRGQLGVGKSEQSCLKVYPSHNMLLPLSQP